MWVLTECVFAFEVSSIIRNHTFCPNPHLASELSQLIAELSDWLPTFKVCPVRMVPDLLPLSVMSLSGVLANARFAGDRGRGHNACASRAMDSGKVSGAITTTLN
jgi:hypothetical protein